MKPVITRQLYLSGDEAMILMQEAQKIMEREKWSFNRLIEEALSEFVRRHKEGNVSFQLSQFGITWKHAISIDDHCGFKGCKSRPFGFGTHLKTKKRYVLCKVHYNSVQDNPNWKVE